jgi:ATP-dependent Clp protease ATP-binding subunit ClpX
VELDFEEEALDAVADLAIDRGTGARGLRAILEEVLMNTMFEVPTRPEVIRVVVDPGSVRRENEPAMLDSAKEQRERSA